MATNRLTPIDSNQLYVYCEVCKSNGTPNSPLIRAMNEVKCQFGHTFSGSLMMSVQPFSGDVPDTAAMDMIPMPLNEQPPPTSVKWQVWVHPKVRDMLEQKYRGRLIATLDSILGCLADGNVLIIEGKDVAKIKKRGASNGAQIIAMLDSMDNIESENRQLRAQIERYESVFRAAGVGQQ
jgi:hypothetical protein